MVSLGSMERPPPAGWPHTVTAIRRQPGMPRPDFVERESQALPTCSILLAPPAWSCCSSAHPPNAARDRRARTRGRSAIISQRESRHAHRRSRAFHDRARGSPSANEPPARRSIRRRAALTGKPLVQCPERVITPHMAGFRSDIGTRLRRCSPRIFAGSILGQPLREASYKANRLLTRQFTNSPDSPTEFVSISAPYGSCTDTKTPTAIRNSQGGRWKEPTRWASNANRLGGEMTHWHPPTVIWQLFRRRIRDRRGHCDCSRSCDGPRSGRSTRAPLRDVPGLAIARKLNEQSAAVASWLA